MSAQLAMAFAGETSFRPEDFIQAGSNALAVALVAQWPNWGAPYAILYGPEGSGKTHLAHVWAARAGARFMDAAGLRTWAAQPSPSPWVFEGAEALGDEALLFHALNLVREQGTSALLTLSRAPNHVPVALPDLRSRLLAAPAAALSEPDDGLLGAVLRKLASDRQIRLSAPVVDFLVRRMPRSFTAARALVAALDKAALEAGKGLGLGFVRQWWQEQADKRQEPLW